jgi:hypothetical protein
MWASLSYLVRAYIITDAEYALLDHTHLIRLAKETSAAIMASFGRGVMMYNVHQLLHLHW